MNRIAPDHLAREAVVYIRQSTQDQSRHNHESRRRQYGLADRAHRLVCALLQPLQGVTSPS